MLSLTEAVAIRTGNERVAELEREANRVIARLQAALRNEKAARSSERAAFELTLREAHERIELLEEIVREG